MDNTRTFSQVTHMEQLQANLTLAHFLVRSGACTEDVANEFRETAARRWKPVGYFLNLSGAMTMKQIFRVLGEQALRPTEVFGELAVEMGVCTREDVDRAREMQSAECPHVFDLALADSRVDREKCMMAVREYMRFAERTLDQLGQQFPDLISAHAR